MEFPYPAIDRSTFTEPAALEHAAMYADAVVALLETGGTDRVSMGVVARWMGQVPSAVQQRAGGRDGFLLMVGRRFGKRWLAWLSQRDVDAQGTGGVVRLPRTENEVHGVRVWSALTEIAAGEARADRSGLAEVLASARQDERSVLELDLTTALGRRPTCDEVTLVQCLADGLRRAQVAAVEPLDFAAAQASARWVVDRLRDVPLPSD